MGMSSVLVFVVVKFVLGWVGYGSLLVILEFVLEVWRCSKEEFVEGSSSVVEGRGSGSGSSGEESGSGWDKVDGGSVLRG